MNDYARELGARLRAIRTQKGLSLHAVEERSNGRWKAVVIGSYERGDRAVTVQRLAELAEFYGVPAERLLPGGGRRGGERSARAGEPRHLVIDLEALNRVTETDASTVQRFAASIQDQRGDYNGRMLSLRDSDVHALSVIYADTSPGGFADRLAGWGVLREDGSPLGG